QVRSLVLEPRSAHRRSLARAVGALRRARLEGPEHRRGPRGVCAITTMTDWFGERHPSCSSQNPTSISGLAELEAMHAFKLLLLALTSQCWRHSSSIRFGGRPI